MEAVVSAASVLKIFGRGECNVEKTDAHKAENFICMDLHSSGSVDSGMDNHISGRDDVLLQSAGL